jgi:hypothetical protein
MKWIKHRLPSWAEMLPVYSVILFCSYTYGLMVFAYNVPSWILMVPLGEILGYFSYGMVLFFLDTLPQLVLVLAMAALLPRPWFLNDFAAVGSVVAGVLFFWITIVQLAFGSLVTMLTPRFVASLAVAFLIHLVSMVVAVKRLPLIRKAVLWLSSSTGLFVYLYGFLTVVGLVVVLIRNLS